MRINFVKMNGAGNDFVMIDHRSEFLKDTVKQLAPKMCHRHFGIGADGLILIEESHVADFKMRIINADGSEAEMCGNGARCAAVFAYRLGAAKQEMRIETLAGVLPAQIVAPDVVKIWMSAPKDLKEKLEVSEKGRLWDVAFVNTGVPHAVVFVQDLAKADVFGMGRILRYHEAFAPAGTNVNVVEVKKSKDGISVRKYERGVEDETFACGTGATAAAIMANRVHGVCAPVAVQVKGGELLIDFKNEDGAVCDVTMQGPALVVFEGGYDVI